MLHYLANDLAVAYLERRVRQLKSCLYSLMVIDYSAPARVTFMKKQPLTGCFIGAVSEWLKEAVLKTVVPQGTGGSNPPCSGNGLHKIDSLAVAFLERCESGRIGLPAKELCPERAPGVRIPPAPKMTVSAKNSLCVKRHSIASNVGDSKRSATAKMPRRKP